MSILKDDWEKPRTKGQHLTKADITLLKLSFRAGMTPKDAARAIQCSSRCARKYYVFFRDEGVMEDEPPRLPMRVNREARLYHGSFEL